MLIPFYGIVASSQGDAGPPPLRMEFVNSYYASPDDVSSQDFTSVPFGTYSADRQIIVVVFTVEDSPGTLSCEIGDDAAPILDSFCATPGNNRRCHIYRGRPAGSTGTITINSTGTFDDSLIAVYKTYEDVVPFQIQKTNGFGVWSQSVALEVPDDGFVIVGAVNAGSSDPGHQSWTGLTLDVERGGSSDFRSTSYLAAVSAASMSGHVGQSDEVYEVESSQTGSYQSTFCAIAYGLSSDVPTCNWVNVWTASNAPTDSSATNLADDTVRSRFRPDAFNLIPPSDITHIRITTWAGAAEGWGCAKAYVGNGLPTPSSDAADLTQITFGGDPDFQNEPRHSRASDPIPFAYGYGNTRLQFSYLVGSDTAYDTAPYETISGAPWYFKSNVDEADDLTVSGYTNWSSIELIGIYRIEFGVNPFSTWLTTMYEIMDSEDNDWSNYTIKQSLTPALLASQAAIPTHTQMRFTFQASNSESLRIDGAYIGHQSGSDGWDAASLTQLTFGGNTFGQAPIGGVLVSDPVTFTYNGTDNLIVSFHMPTDSANTGGSYLNSVTGAQSYYKSGGDESAVANASGYSTVSAGRLHIVSRVEFSP